MAGKVRVDVQHFSLLSVSLRLTYLRDGLLEVTQRAVAVVAEGGDVEGVPIQRLKPRLHLFVQLTQRPLQQLHLHLGEVGQDAVVPLDHSN